MKKCLITTPDGSAVGTGRTNTLAFLAAQRAYRQEHGRAYSARGSYSVEFFQA